jgi:hypothetical protein
MSENDIKSAEAAYRQASALKERREQELRTAKFLDSGVEVAANEVVSADRELAEAERDLHSQQVGAIIDDAAKVREQRLATQKMEAENVAYQEVFAPKFSSCKDNIINSMNELTGAWLNDFTKESGQKLADILPEGSDKEAIIAAQKDVYTKFINKHADRMKESALGLAESLDVNIKNLALAQEYNSLNDEQKIDYEKRVNSVVESIEEIAEIKKVQFKSLMHSLDEQQRESIQNIITNNPNAHGKDLDKLIIDEINKFPEKNEILTQKTQEYEKLVSLEIKILNATELKTVESGISEFKENLTSTSLDNYLSSSKDGVGDVKLFLGSVVDKLDGLSEEQVKSFAQGKWSLSQDPQDIYSSTIDRKMNIALVNEKGEKFYGRFSYDDMIITPTSNGAMGIAFYNFKDSEITSNHEEFLLSLDRSKSPNIASSLSTFGGFGQGKEYIPVGTPIISEESEKQKKPAEVSPETVGETALNGLGSKNYTIEDAKDIGRRGITLSHAGTEFREELSAADTMNLHPRSTIIDRQQGVSQGRGGTAA